MTTTRARTVSRLLFFVLVSALPLAALGLGLVKGEEGEGRVFIGAPVGTVVINEVAISSSPPGASSCWSAATTMP